MAEISLPVIVTAVADPDLEGFIAGTLFAQGWSVVFRALDAQSLHKFFETYSAQIKQVVLIYSPDLPGLTPSAVQSIELRVKQVIGFSSEKQSDEQFSEILSRPQDAISLITLVRGFVRAPMLRTSARKVQSQRRAKVVAIASPSGSTGCTTIAINLAMELSQLDKETLLIDADVRRPAIAPLLSLHALETDMSPRLVSTKLNVCEYGREQVNGLSEYMDEVLDRNDFVILDLGSIEGVEDSLTDRRWTASLVHWSCDQADELWIVGKADVLGIIRLESMVRNFSQINIRARISLLLNMRNVGRKGADQERLFVSASSGLKPHRVFTLPKDPSSVMRAEIARCALVEANSRSPLRRAIAKLAGEIVA